MLAIMDAEGSSLGSTRTPSAPSLRFVPNPSYLRFGSTFARTLSRTGPIHFYIPSHCNKLSNNKIYISGIAVAILWYAHLQFKNLCIINSILKEHFQLLWHATFSFCMKVKCSNAFHWFLSIIIGINFSSGNQEIW